MEQIRELKERALQGDRKALQKLRSMGFFEKKPGFRKGGEPEAGGRPQRGRHYAVSHAQRRLWLLAQMDGGSVAYNLPGAFLLEGKLDRHAFEATFTELIKRHESLRTNFVVVHGELRQEIHDGSNSRVAFLDLTGERDAEQRAAEMAAQGAVKPFDLETEPLIRSSLLKVGDDRHVMVLTMHHIISDGWSMENLMRDFGALYNAYAQGQESPLPRMRIQYRDYAAWQNRLLESEEVETHRRYWHEKLSGEIPLLNLPTDAPRPSRQTFRGARVSFVLPAEQRENLKRLSRERGASLFMTLLAAVKVLLFRYTGQEDILVGSPVAGRNHPDLEDQIGFYVNTLALRDRLTDDIPFDVFLKQVRETTTEAHAHQGYPFDSLVEELDLRRDLSRSPLFDVMVVLQNGEVQRPALKDLRARLLRLDPPISKFDLSFAFAETEGGLSIDIEYSTDLFRQERIHRMGQHLRHLLSGILEDAGRPVGRLPMVSESERRRILHEFNDTSVAYPRDKTIVDLFEAQVERTPDHVAVVSGKKRLTYRELNERANGLAHYLRDRCQVHSEKLVGMILERSESAVLATLGIMKSGGTYLPIDPAYPPERIRFILEDSGCTVILTEKSDTALSEVTARNPMMRVIDLNALQGGKRSNPVHVLSRDRLAYVLYTSGSTGRPKGVMIEHGGFVNMCLDQIRCFGVSESDRILQFASLSFDASLYEMFMALLSGATLAVAGKEIINHTDRFIRFLEDEGVTVATLPPVYLHALNRNELKTVKTIITAGEPAIVQDVLFYSRCKQVINAYGPTETSVCVCVHRVDPGRAYQNGIPIGRPIANTSILILDDHLNPVPIGVPGEICMAGVGLARGYLNNEGLTETKFIPHPFQDGERLYRSGDLGRWLEGGEIEFLGRRDDQVKIRGFRIELGEIENRLSQHEAVKEAAVLARTLKDDAKELAAYVVSDREVSVAELRSYLKASLPEYMVPPHFIQMKALPLTPSGKVDKKALPAPSGAGMALGTQYAAPQDEKETAIALVWEAVLGREKVGIRDNYFSLGGDSIKAIQVMSRLRQAGWKIEMRDLFQYPTVEELAPRMEQAGEVAVEDEVGGVCPLTPIQRWLFEQQGFQLHHFNQAVLLKGKPRFEEKALKEALSALQEHHDAFRLRYGIKEGEIIQSYSESPSPLSFEVVDLKGTHDAAARMEFHAGALQASLGLEEGPLFRAALYRLEGGDRLLMVIHHLMVDGVSWRVLLEDLNAGYGLALKGEPVRLPPRTSSFKAWAERIQGYSRSASLEKEKAYWHGVAGTEPSSLPSDYEGGRILRRVRRPFG